MDSLPNNSTFVIIKFNRCLNFLYIYSLHLTFTYTNYLLSASFAIKQLVILPHIFLQYLDENFKYSGCIKAHFTSYYFFIITIQLE